MSHSTTERSGRNRDDGGVRILVTFAGGSGHFLPTVPFARALRERGHEVRYACQEGMVAAVAAEGWRTAPSGGNTLLDSRTRRPLAALDRQAEDLTVRRSFAGTLARERTVRLLEIAGQWRPDLIVRDEVDFAGAVAADVLGLPHAAVVVIAAGGFLRPDVVDEPIAALRAEHGLDPTEVVGDVLHRYLTVVPVPPSFRDPSDPLPRTAHGVRPTVLDQTEGGRWAHRTPVPGSARPRVYVTLGTIFNQESGDLFERILTGLAALPLEVVATVGHQIDPAELGRLPPNVRIEQFLPVEETLACCDAVVSHGGSGTVIAALGFGLPQVVLPLGADQPLNADRCVALRVGIALDAVDSTSETIGEATLRVLKDEAYRVRAGRLRAECLSLPDARHIAVLLERLARTRSPVLHP